MMMNEDQFVSDSSNVDFFLSHSSSSIISDGDSSPYSRRNRLSTTKMAEEMAKLSTIGRLLASKKAEIKGMMRKEAAIAIESVCRAMALICEGNACIVR